jgi:hypothetical protein
LSIQSQITRYNRPTQQTPCSRINISTQIDYRAYVNTDINRWSFLLTRYQRKISQRSQWRSRSCGGMRCIAHAWPTRKSFCLSIYNTELIAVISFLLFFFSVMGVMGVSPCSSQHFVMREKQKIGSSRTRFYSQGPAGYLRCWRWAFKQHTRQKKEDDEYVIICTRIFFWGVGGMRRGRAITNRHSPPWVSAIHFWAIVFKRDDEGSSARP